MGVLPGSAWVQPEPLGIVLIVGPCGYPSFLTLDPVAGLVVERLDQGAVGRCRGPHAAGQQDDSLCDVHGVELSPRWRLGGRP